MNAISFNTANFVARQLNWRMTEGWLQGDRAAQDWFRPKGDFGERFGAMLDEVVGLGFDALDLWLAHLHPDWASAEHIALAREALAVRGLRVTTLAGGFGDTRETFLASCRIAQAVGARVLGGGAGVLARDRIWVVDTLGARGLRLGLENHPEKNPRALRDRIGDGAGVIGAMVDTGWFGTQGYDAAAAITELRDALFGVHLKDVLAAGAHHTCRFGQGIVPLRACVRALRQIGYADPLSIEHEPEQGDPRPDVAASAALVRAWLAEPLTP